ncbi:hypothetical protein BGW38_007981, partial [Lunasporangiospora selenospora]
MLFPNVATHRRLPHLQKHPKDEKDKVKVKDKSHAEHLEHNHLLPLDHGPLDPLAPTQEPSPRAIAQGLTSTPSVSSPLIVSDGQQHQMLTCSEPTVKLNLSVNTQPITGSGTNSIKNSTPESASGTPPHNRRQSGQDSAPWVAPNQLPPHHHSQGPSLQSPPHALDNALQPPSGASTAVLASGSSETVSSAASMSSSSLSLNPAPSSLVSSTQESKLLRSTLYDAFGCLYHPVQHTHHPTSGSSASTPSCCGPVQSPLARQSSMPSFHCSGICQGLRSGDATPSHPHHHPLSLLAVTASPRTASPMLRPMSGASAPITPLDLSEDESSGYFFSAHVHTNGTSSGSGSGTAGSTTTTRPIHTHQSHCQSYQHHSHSHGLQPHHPRRGSAQPNGAQTRQENDVSSPRRASTSASTTTPTTRQTSTFASSSSSSSSALNPAEHPVLCSLHTLSLTHPHPAQHYHPTLGHDLGHDRVSISDSEDWRPMSGSGMVGRVGKGLFTTTTTPSATTETETRTMLMNNQGSQRILQPVTTPNRSMPTKATQAENKGQGQGENRGGGGALFSMDHHSGEDDLISRLTSHHGRL